MTYKVLIVDDSKLARMAAVKALTGCYPDWSRVEVGSAADALKAMLHEPPDIALVDFNMPDRDGLDLAGQLRKLSPQMPIAVISANRQQEIVNRTRDLGATFLAKPLSGEELGAFLKSAANDLKKAAP